jgi:ABC-type branched-subunit amino acid transport system ATPase component/ABC-type branched-subunit amino acid transport system permease subunit
MLANCLHVETLCGPFSLGPKGAEVLAAAWITRQALFDGAVQGMVFGLIAMGIVLVHRSTKVINFAVANLGLFGTALFALLGRQYRLPYWLAAAIGLTVGALLGALVEATIIRRLFKAPRVIVLVATIGIAQLGMLLTIALPKITVAGRAFPIPIGKTYRAGGLQVRGPQLTNLIVIPLIAITLGLLLNRTALGKAVKASADNPDLARLAGISPKVVSTAVWAIAGALATVAISLLAGQQGTTNSLTALGPSTMVKALVAAVIAGMYSLRGAFFAGIAVGVVQALVQFNLTEQPGLFDFLLVVFVMVAVYRQSRGGAAEARTFAYAAKVQAVPERMRSIWWIRSLDRIGFVVIGIAAVVLPLIITKPSRHLLFANVLALTICGLSLTILTGWAGQISLCQLAFGGIGAFLAARFIHGMNVDVHLGATRILKAGIQPLPFTVSILIACLLTALIAVVIGASSLRVRGLFLAVTTFAFAFAATQYLYRRPILNGGAKNAVKFQRTFILGIDVKSQRAYYFVVLAITVVVVAAVGRLRRSGIARTTIAVRDNPETAAAYTISAARTKLRAFALAGFLASLGGALFAANVQTIPNDRFFTVNDSLQLVAVVVIGGIGSVGGAVIGAVFVLGLPALFPDNDIVPLLSSSIGVLLLLMYFPGGFVQVGYALRDLIVRTVEKRLPPAPVKQRSTVPASLVHAERPALTPGTPALRVSNVSVRFGGIVAVNKASIEVADGEIVGLIGTNGAGKSTLMNAISGFVPSTGSIELFGTDVSKVEPSRRATYGLGRTFQAANLFPELTVTETMLVALEAQHRTGSVITTLISPFAGRRERARRAQAAEIIDFLGLGRYADAHISDLSTGTRRIVELAGLLALDARLLCLDEPTAGLAQRETEAFGPLIRNIRRELNAAMLVIEHDMPLIMSISDRVYCLESGQVIAAGDPASVRNDPLVIASYLGTDERAISRSGAIAT